MWNRVCGTDDFSFCIRYKTVLIAQVAKLVDALCSGRSVRKDVLVRIQSWAQIIISKSYKSMVCKIFLFPGALKETF